MDLWDQYYFIHIQEYFILLHFALLCFTDWDLPPVKRLPLTLLQWSGAERTVSLRCACICAEGSLEGREGGQEGERKDRRGKEGREGEIGDRRKERETGASEITKKKKLSIPQPALSLAAVVWLWSCSLTTPSFNSQPARWLWTEKEKTFIQQLWPQLLPLHRFLSR